MKPTLGYLILARDFIIDLGNNEPSAIRIFDTLYILKGQTVLIYPLMVIGRLYLNTAGIIPSVQIKLKLSDPTDTEMKTETLTASNINGAFGINLPCKFGSILFQLEGKYKIETSVSIDGINFIDAASPVTYFQVKKQI